MPEELKQVASDTERTLSAREPTRARKTTSSGAHLGAIHDVQPASDPSGGIVDDAMFILATRDTGYRSIAAAASELIDNALQAGARHIQILIREHNSPAGEQETWAESPVTHSSRQLVVGVLDDGEGMAPALLQQALKFGGTTRFNDRSGLGRFGMGLPNSSVSQSRRLDVYSWKDIDKVYHSYLDVDEVVQGKLRSIPPATLVHLPGWTKEAAEIPPSGTLVLWQRCDRLGRSRATTLIERLRAPLGRTYRFSIWGGIRITMNGEPLEALDPLFIQVKTGGASPYGAPLCYEISLPASGRSSVVEVRFSELPIVHWHNWPAAQKRRTGIIGNGGVSIVRAGREIDYGWHLMGGKRRENYDDWWRCEIRFMPELDELFGVTNSKQGISPSAELRSLLESDLERVARTLNARARDTFERLKTMSTEATPAIRAATRADEFLPRCDSTGSAKARPHEVRNARFADSTRYRIDVRPIGTPEFFRVVKRNGILVLVINRDHPFFQRVYQPSCADPTGRERFWLECLLLSAGRAETMAAAATRRCAAELRQHWGDALAAFLEA